MAQYLKLFKTEADYEAVVGTENEPNVAHIIEDVEIKQKKEIDFNGHCYVDLGLPSGTLWACYNVGASTETGYGNYYAYGKGSKTYNNNDPAYTATTENLPMEVDTARQVMGGDWHTPTKEQAIELGVNTIFETDVVIGGVKGIKLTSKVNDNYIFFPFAGNYYNGRKINVGTWAFFMTSTMKQDTTHLDCTVNYFSHYPEYSCGEESNRTQGKNVRGVIG
jgi:hypothetical protein